LLILSRSKRPYCFVSVQYVTRINKKMTFTLKTIINFVVPLFLFYLCLTEQWLLGNPQQPY